MDERTNFFVGGVLTAVENGGAPRDAQAGCV